MLPEKYDNSSYWVDIHHNYSGSLRAVGWPTLSEEYNKLKYYSESESFLKAMDRAVEGKNACSVLEVGVGIGYWTALQYEYGRKKGMDVHVTALDISDAALTLVKEKFPDVEAVQADLKLVDVDARNGRHDLVTAIMVLLHLTDVEDYMHALAFCARSVKEGGVLMIYEPLLHRHYSPFNSIEYDAFAGNSIPRSLSMIDNILRNNGMSKYCVLPGASWILNSPIQANSKFAFGLKQAVWRLLAKLVFGSDRMTRIFSGFVVFLDRMFKTESADSGTFVLYKKQSGAKP